MTILLMVIFRNYLEPDKTSISCIFKDNYNRRFVFGYTYIYEDIIKESPQGLVPRPPANTKTQGCLGPIHKSCSI